MVVTSGYEMIKKKQILMPAGPGPLRPARRPKTRLSPLSLPRWSGLRHGHRGLACLWIVVAAWVALAPGARAALGSPEELLEPDKAFALSTRTVDANTLEARWKIADGYYMYQDKFKFQVLSGGIELKDPVFPKAKKKEDPLFGNVEVYVKEAVIRLPLERTRTTAHQAKLRITAQGCNEPVGVCYPPITKEIAFELPAVTAASGGISSLAELTKTLDADIQEPEFLEPDQAFRVAVSMDPKGEAVVDFVIAEGYYLYRDKLKFTLVDEQGKPLPASAIGPYTLPKGKVKDDPYFGKTEIYTLPVSVRLPLTGDTRGARLKLVYQGCADEGICYPPITKTFPLSANTAAAAAGGVAEKGAAPPAAAGTESAATTKKGGGTGKFWIILGAFGAGLLLTFTPCVLPMIPILASVIVGQSGKKVSKLRGGALASSYVLGTAATYTGIGAFAGATGEQLQAYFQNAWAIGILSGILVVLALAMFGLYELQIPSHIQSRLQKHSRAIAGGSFVGTFLLGLVSALIVGACVSPVLISALSVAILSQDPVLGGAIMFSMALGMGVILIAVGFGAAFLVPKAGVWMERVKHFFGVLLLGVAIYILGTLPQVPVLFLWAALLIVTSIYFGATQPLPEGASGWRYFWKGLGTVMLLWGVLALVGGMMGNRDILRPIPALSLASVQTGAGSLATPEEGHLFERVGRLDELEARLAEARQAGRPVILDFFATWCVDCVRMEETTFRNPTVARILRERYVLLQVDVTDPKDPEGKAIKKRFNVFGPPAMLFFDRDGKERKDLHFYGYKSPEEFLALLNRA